METKMVTRILKEIQEINEGDEHLKDQILLQAIDDADIRKLRGFIRGPPDTPYESGIFNLSITLPDEYPFKPPMVTFLTKIYHPNIKTAGGYICLDVLAQAWSPTMTLKSMLLSLQLLLQDPRPDDPLEPTIAYQLRTNRETFNRTAFFWTGEHALTPEERSDEWKRMNAMVSNVAKKRRMGRVKAVNTLARQGWKEVSRKRRRNQSDQDEEDDCDDEEDGPTVASRRRRNSPVTSSVQEDEEETDEGEEIPPEVLRMIANGLIRRGMNITEDSDDQEDD